MLDPQPPGTWSGSSTLDKGRCVNFLEVKRRYRVITPFTDYDGALHQIGETWTFLGHNFIPYEDGMSWFVATDDAREWQIRLQWRAEAQSHVLDQLQRYLVPVE